MLFILKNMSSSSQNSATLSKDFTVGFGLYLIISPLTLQNGSPFLPITFVDFVAFTNLSRTNLLRTSLKTLQSMNVWVTSLGFWYNFGGKQDECLETDKFGQTAYSLFRR